MGFTTVAPESAAEACRLLAESSAGTAAVLAGGTDLLLDIDAGRIAPERVVSLRKLPWRTLRWDDGVLTIGSTLPLSEVESDPLVRERLPVLWEAVHAVGSLPLRHRATLGGNLGRASPASDILPALLALDATVDLVGPDGSRSVDLDRFLVTSRAPGLRPGELIRSIRIPEPRPSSYVWQRVRPANDISQVGIAVARASRPPYWRVALSGAPPRTVRLIDVERELRAERPLSSELERAVEAARRTAPFATDKRATDGYRRRLVGVLVRRAVTAVAPPIDPPVGIA